MQSIMRVDRFDGHGQRVCGELIFELASGLRSRIETNFAIRCVALGLLIKENSSQWKISPGKVSQ